jgi:DNA-directed RNA polymerase specialized sigma24 family protein
MDRYGDFDRVPPAPKRGILVMLGRVTDTASKQAVRARVLHRRLDAAEKKLVKATTYADRMVATRLVARTKTSIAKLVGRQTYTYRRLVSLLVAAKERSTNNRTALKVVGRKEIDARICRAQTAHDVLAVRLVAQEPAANEAYKRLHAIVEPMTNGLLWQAIRGRRLREDEAKERRDVAIWRAACQYSWRHKAAFATYAFRKVRRELQLRSKHERPLLEHIIPGTETYAVAGSLSVLDTCGSGSHAFEPVMASASDANSHAVVRATTLRAESHARHGAARDVHAALGLLSDEDRAYAVAMWIEGCTVSETAERLGVTETRVRTKRATICAHLRDALADYADEGSDL